MLSQQVIELVALARGKAGLADSLLDALFIEVVMCAGRGDNILLYHDGAEVICTAMQCRLGSLFTDSEP